MTASDPAGAGRELFRYLNGESWLEYRAIMGLFAGTFFSDFSPAEVTAALAAGGVELPEETVLDRLESLRGWGNLTVSTTTVQATSLAEYYRLRNRFLITRAGQEVHDLVEQVLGRVDQVRDVSASRLRALRDALGRIGPAMDAGVDDETLSDLVGAVFDPHQAFTSEITQFFAALNQWQSRYDLSVEEFRFFAEILVGYVSERLEEIARTARPIAVLLEGLRPRIGHITARVHTGLAGRVAAAGMAGQVQVEHRPGSAVADWVHLERWFISDLQHPSRLQQLEGQAMSAVRTLTLNLTRLSRVGSGASSRRSDFLRLAGIIDRAEPEQVPQLLSAAFGLYPSVHFGALAVDELDPVSPATSWWEAPRATVPVALRERGDTAIRGQPSPMPDKRRHQELIRIRRHHEALAQARARAELLDGPLERRVLSEPAARLARQLLAGAMARLGARAPEVAYEHDGLRCSLRRDPTATTRWQSHEGTLTLQGLRVGIDAATRPRVSASAPDSSQTPEQAS